MRALMDINIATPPRVARTAEGLRDVEEWGLKVQKMANVHSITLAFVCPLHLLLLLLSLLLLLVLHLLLSALTFLGVGWC